MTTAWERTGRPKPPEITGGEPIEYRNTYRATVVFRDSCVPYWVTCLPGGREAFHHTHTEAITWAQEQARKDTRNGLVQGR